MLLPATQMHIITFIFVCIELVVFFYLVIYRLARPDDKITFLNIVLIFLLITYNVTGGLLPDPNLPGSIFTQLTIAYATGFITPCYFPYYVYKAFGLEKMKFHAYRGVFLFLLLPYFIFVIVYGVTNNLEDAKDLLILPVLYAIWVIVSLYRSIRYKYKNDFSSTESKEEVVVLFLSLTPWVGLPVIDFFDLGQGVEAAITNTGFLLLLALQVKKHIRQMRIEHQKLIESESRLLNWNTKLQQEVNKRTSELEKINEQKTNTFINLAHETKTPLTLINNYLEQYLNKRDSSEEISIIKKNIEKLSSDIINFFDLEKFNKGIAVYNHNLISSFSDILRDNLVLFKEFSKKRNININGQIENDLFIKTDPVAINRIINNLIENAIKYSEANCDIEVSLYSKGDEIVFSVKDYGIGIPVDLHKKVFEPYYQISNQKRSTQGMGLGLPIVKKVIQDLNGEIEIESNPQTAPGTKIIVSLIKHNLTSGQVVSPNVSDNNILNHTDPVSLDNIIHDIYKQTILVVEDNVSMMNYLIIKLRESYNVYAALNGQEALKKLKNEVLPDLIISDVMMDKMDGYTFATIISKTPSYNHIPLIFLSAKSTKNDRFQGLSLGAIDFIQKPFSINELIQKIESILSNALKQRSAVLTTAINSISVSKNIQPPNISDAFDQNCQLYNLTSREKEIAKLICQGSKYKNIGEALFISERTVTKYAQNIFEKVQVSNKIELCNKLEA